MVENATTKRKSGCWSGLWTRLAYVAASIILASCGGNSQSSSTPDHININLVASALEANPNALLSSKVTAHVGLSGLQPTATNDRFIVKYKDGTLERNSIAAVQARLDSPARNLSYKTRHLHRLGVGADVIRVAKGLTAGEAESYMRQVAKDPDVEYIEPDAIMQTAMVPNDSLYNQQWGFAPNKTMGVYQGINAEGAWDLSSGAGIVIAEIDNGVTKHSDLDANVLPGIGFRSGEVIGDGSNQGMSPDVGCTVVWHGTHVAGTLAAVTNNGMGVAGVAWGAKILPVQVLNGCGYGYVSDIADGIVWATGGLVPNAPINMHPAQVVNMSLGGLAITGDCAQTYQTAIDGAVERGATIVVAAGNSANEAGWYQPANCKHVIVVAGHESNGQIVDSSNRGPLITVSAPGWYVRSTYNDGNYFPGAESYLEMTGTSMATPHVAGVAALMQAIAPTRLSAGEVRSILRGTAREAPPLYYAAAANLVDATAAVKKAKMGSFPPVAELDCVAGDMMFVKCTDKSSHRGGTIVSRSYNFDSKNSNSFWSPSNPLGDISNFYEYSGTYYITQKIVDSSGETDQVTSLLVVPNPDVQELTPNQSVQVNSNGAYSAYFSMKVPPGATNLRFKISGGTGNANLYVRKDSPTLLNPLCAPFKPGNEEECVFANPTPGTYYVLMNSQPDFDNVTLVGSYIPQTS